MHVSIDASRGNNSKRVQSHNDTALKLRKLYLSAVDAENKERRKQMNRLSKEMLS